MTTTLIAMGGVFGAQARDDIREERPRIFINPGHGGQDSDDRPNPFHVYGAGKKITYYESVSNLSAGKALFEILKSKGYDVMTSRVNNTTDDDLTLFEICALAANSGADMFYAVHSNATGSKSRVNFPLGLYRGFDGKPAVEGNDEIAAKVTRHLGDITATVWSGKPLSRGDWSFYNWGYKVGLGVLTFNKLPGMLCEMSFFDYVPERCRYLSNDYCWLLAWCQSMGIDDYFGMRRMSRKGVLAGSVREGTSRYKGSHKVMGADSLQARNAVDVILYDHRGRELSRYTTDNFDNGFYLFKDLNPGKYTVKFDLEGKSQDNVDRPPFEYEVEVKPNNATYQNWYNARKIKPQPAEEVIEGEEGAEGDENRPRVNERGQRIGRSIRVDV